MRSFGGASIASIVLSTCCLLQGSSANHVHMMRGTPFLVKPSSLQTILDIRGGAKRRPAKTATLHSTSKKTVTGKKKVGAASQKEKKSPISDSLQKYKQILPLTRLYISMVGIVTVAGMILGEELTQGLMALDPLRLLYGLELWRPFTAACFLGPPSIGWLMSGYYLFEYGSTLERTFGTAQHLVFLLTEICLLTVLSALFGLPFFAPSVITAMLHVLSRSRPREKVKWLVFTVPYWALPYGLMASDVLQAGSLMAALPHVLGIVSGHFYHFHKFIWPKMGGDDWLVAPDFMVQRLDPNAKTSSKTKNAKDAVNISLKRRKGKGRKLGGK